VKRFLLALTTLCACLLFLVPPASAEFIVIYGDQGGSLCGLATAGYAKVYVFDYTATASGTKFRLDTTNVPGTTLIAFSSPYAFTGDVNSLISINYGACYSGSFLVGTIDLVAACGWLGFQDVTFIDCQQHETPGEGWPFPVCTSDEYCPPFATEEATWGSVKALYR
jgi:hypothetical protein